MPASCAAAPMDAKESGLKNGVGKRQRTVEATAATPYRDNIADSCALIAELKARPPDAPVPAPGRRLDAHRQRYIDEGGTFVKSEEEFQRLVRAYRFGIED